MCLRQHAEMFVHLMGKGRGFPTQWLIGVEFFVPGSGGDNAVTVENGEQVGKIALGRVVYPTLVGVCDYYNLFIRICRDSRKQGVDREIRLEFTG